MAVTAALLLPLGLASAGGQLFDPRVLALGAVVGLLSSTLPYSLQFEALRRLPARVVSVLLSLEPVVAALAGLLILGEVLGARELLAIGLIVVASSGSARSASDRSP